MGPPLALPLLLLLLLLPRAPPAAPAPAPRARPLPGLLGCLFEDQLCGPTETCVNDGLFGRCQEFPATDTRRHEASPGDLQHLTAALRKLSRSGSSWQDTTAQHLMARELSHLPQTYPRRPDASHLARSPKQSVQDERGLSREGNVLAEVLQRYLPYLEALAQAAAPNTLPGLKLDRPLAQGEDPLAESALTFVAQTSALTFAPEPRADFPGGRPLPTLRRLQPDELTPKAVGGVDRQNLVTALSAYAARKPPLPPREGDPAPRNLLSAPWREPRVLSALAAPQRWPSPAGDPRNAPGMDDEARVQTLVRGLPQHLGGMEGLGALDVDAMARAIASALPSGGADGEQGGAWPGDGGPRGQADRLEVAPHGGDQTGDAESKDGGSVHKEVSRSGARLGDPLQGPGSPLLPGAPQLAEPFKTEIKKSEAPAAPLSSEEERAGVESVRSRTYTKELAEGLLKPGPGLGPGAPRGLQRWAPVGPPSQGLRLEAKSSGEQHGYIVTQHDPLNPEEGKVLLEHVARLLEVPADVFVDIGVAGPTVTFRVSANARNVTPADAVKAAADNKEKLEEMSGLKILQTGVGSRSKLRLLPHQAEQDDSAKFIVLTLVSIVAVVGVLLASSVFYCLRHSSHHRLKEKLSGLGGGPGPDAPSAYQELCRQRMAVRTSERPEAPHTSRVSSVSSQFSDGPMPSPSARSSTSSWSEEPVQPNMDISTGHMVLAYMEDHLEDKNRLQREWEALCAYQAEPSCSLVAQREENVPKNRCPAVLTYDHSRIRLSSGNSHSSSDYINASPIMDHDPRKPAYIATQGPLPATVADFWQMVWESGCVVIVMLTPLSENGVRQCYHYWPDEGSNLYHIYEVNLVSEHIWCEDFLVRSFYLKNLRTSETRTVSQFHFLSWHDQAVPASTRSLLDFRRKVNKCYRGRSCPIIVHCSDGAGRSGTYVLIDMVLNKMAKGAKEIDIAATLEHLRDQRPGMVQTKEQFEFALTAVAEEVNAILQAFPQ
ncbi:receptor-type tyrosine-protein phosphatase N2 isoform X1 [Camelus bactrianus]|uniref:Receptor-type tyrosine-protein phosphatase N2 isoform X1 n=1 Tax=Camelus bactrianus TaxID=9837 RepID=A0AC58QKC0_CAMBA